MEISVRQTTIEPEFISVLLSNGIVLVSHLNTFSASRLSSKTKLKLQVCENILNSTKPKRAHYVMRASDLIVRPFECIKTLSEGLDTILGGGVRCGQLTGISGEAGAGKSNLCAQIGISAMLPPYNTGKPGGHVLLIHTEGEGKLKLCVKRFGTLASSVDREDLVCTNLHVMNCTNEFELAEMVDRLPKLIDELSGVKMIIIDSITCAFMTTDEDTNIDFYMKRNLRLTKIVKKLHPLAWDHRLAILITNHVSFSPKAGDNRPAMGRAWSSMCQTKIYLDRSRSRRYANVTKGAMSSPTPVEINISNYLANP